MIWLLFIGVIGYFAYIGNIWGMLITILVGMFILSRGGSKKNSGNSGKQTSSRDKGQADYSGFHKQKRNGVQRSRPSTAKSYAHQTVAASKDKAPKEEYIHGDIHGYYTDPDALYLQRREKEELEERERERKSEVKRESENRKRRDLEDEARRLRKHNAEHWRVKAVDDELGRSYSERKWEDQKEDYEPECSECNYWKSQCRCCDTCERYPCQCCYKCKSYPCECCDTCNDYPCQCCRSCDSFPCECCSECGQSERYCRCCNNCERYPCECCRECGEADCRCCSTCDTYPCRCCNTCDDYPCRCCRNCDDYPCQCCRSCGEYPCECCSGCGNPNRYCRCDD